jgi:Gnt-I system high-affinity gluconate transporter
MLTAIVIALIILIGLILLRVNAFLAFLISSIAVGLISGMEVKAIIGAIESGLGDTLGSLTIILGFGAVIGRLMAESGAAKQIANRMVQVFGGRYLKWAMALIGFIVGIPMFFAIGFVILVPLMFSIAGKAKVPFLYLGIPLVAALSVTHGLLPPHPAPVAIAQQFGADMGEVILWGFVLSVPTIIIAGPVFASALKKIEAKPLKIFMAKGAGEEVLPGITLSIICALLPIVLLMLETVTGHLVHGDSATYQIILFLSQPLTAMLISTIVILYLLELRLGKKLNDVMKLMEEAISGIAMILLIIGGAGALKQVFVEAGLVDYLAEALKSVHISPILLCWGIAALIRIAVGSATVAAMTTAGMLAPVLVSGVVNPVLLVLATGSGSIIFSHVNDGGFWLFKEYFNLSIKDTLLSWSMMETIIALCGLAGCLILNMFI